jgi:hypothetical protein
MSEQMIMHDTNDCPTSNATTKHVVDMKVLSSVFTQYETEKKIKLSEGDKKKTAMICETIEVLEGLKNPVVIGKHITKLSRSQLYDAVNDKKASVDELLLIYYISQTLTEYFAEDFNPNRPQLPIKFANMVLDLSGFINLYTCVTASLDRKEETIKIDEKEGTVLSQYISNGNNPENNNGLVSVMQMLQRMPVIKRNKDIKIDDKYVYSMLRRCNIYDGAIEMAHLITPLWEMGRHGKLFEDDYVILLYLISQYVKSEGKSGNLDYFTVGGGSCVIS